MRSLYDVSFLASDCTIPYNESSNVDNLTATYITNYLMAVVGLASALSVWFTSPGRRNDIYMTVFFAFFGTGNMIISASKSSNSLSHMNDLSINALLMVIISHYFIAVSYSALLYTGIRGLTSNRFIRYGWFIISVGVLIMAGLFRVFSIVIVWGFVVGIIMIILYVLHGFVVGGSRLCFVKALGIVIYISAGLMQAWLDGKCGASGYVNCFEECPLPTSFNHNALYHVLTTLGMIIHVIAEVKNLSSRSFIPSHTNTIHNINYSENNINDNNNDTANKNEDGSYSTRGKDVEAQSDIEKENDITQHSSEFFDDSDAGLHC